MDHCTLLKKRYEPNKILDLIDFKHKIIEIDGYQVSITRTIKLFKNKGIKCSKCGREGEFFKIGKYSDSQTYHLRLFARDDKRGVVMMTRDHIIPLHKGGSDRWENLQVMCGPCNWGKGGKESTFKTIKIKTKIFFNKVKGLFTNTNNGEQK